MISKKVLIPALVISIVAAGAIFKVSYVEAVSSSPKTGLIQYLAQKLGIDQTKVQTAVDEYHTQQQTNRQKENTENYTVYLDGLVKQGKITDSQKTALLAKHTELQSTRQTTDWSTKTPSERQALIDQEKAKLEEWAKQQGIDVSYLRFGFGGGNKGNRGMMHE
ncbi:MAG TPA: hypothetical protein PK370_03340 [Candidatus Woesebacteria bacterium]|nr:hypothetical protein [Candidatus Woesebacteria bacterium]HPJ17381.1 hypothetical protein [Candidatus Woesebacteria bacterium]